MKARFAHVNVIARDWRKLAAFYQKVFGCEPVPPQRDFRGKELAAGTAVPDAALQGIHLRLPGGGDQGPTLEIFTYTAMDERGDAQSNSSGFVHIAFVVEDVAAAQKEFLAAGGKAVGQIVTLSVDTRRVTWCYCRDPEGNIVELQSWS